MRLQKSAAQIADILGQFWRENLTESSRTSLVTPGRERPRELTAINKSPTALATRYRNGNLFWIDTRKTSCMRTIAIPFLNLGDQASAQPVDKSPAEIWGPRFALLVLLIWVAAFAIGFTASLAMLTAIGFAAAITGLRSPIVGLLGIGLLCTLESYTRAYLMTGGLLRFHTFNYWLLIVMVIGAPLVLRRNDPHSRLLQLYSIVLMLGLLFSPDPMSGVSHILNIVTMFGLLVYFLRG